MFNPSFAEKRDMATQTSFHSFVIAAIASGSGKTTVTLGLMRALRRRGLGVAPFKCGPDYIDTAFHSVAAGRESVNLDIFMGSRSLCRRLYASGCSHADVAVTEGVMGLYDGYDADRGSAAEIARLTGQPVVLVVDATSKAYSAAAIIYGFTHFRPDIDIVGVIFNKVGSEAHERLLRQACAAAGTELLGMIRRDPGLVTPSRHLGLTLTARPDTESFIEAAADAAEAQVDIDRLLELTVTPHTISDDVPVIALPSAGRVAVARDEAFSFIYPANIAALTGGTEPAYFSPLHDTELPDADFIYLPGGYPELYLRELSDNRPMMEQIRSYSAAGGRMLAECGGMLYLSDAIDGACMCGVLPIEATMDGARLRLGYRTVNVGDIRLRGHEFHYSRIVNPGALPSIARQTDVRGREVDTPLYRVNNTIAGYTHLYWPETGIMNLFNS